MSFQTKLGLAAVLLLVVALVSYPLAFAGLLKMPFAAAMRLGIVLCLLWLAWNDLARFPRWAYAMIVASAVVGAIWPWSLCLIIPGFLLFRFLRPSSSSTKKK
ncbi:MAG: hypothetical protein ACRC46_13670 [Thermoguttaceae bacterium]